jgi:hypothetical protein
MLNLLLTTPVSDTSSLDQLAFAGRKDGDIYDQAFGNQSQHLGLSGWRLGLIFRT